MVSSGSRSAEAQPIDLEEARTIAGRVHDEGGYPDDLRVDPGLTLDGSLAGAFERSDQEGTEVVPTVTTGEREGDEARSFHLPMPEWLRRIFVAIGEALGSVFAVFGSLAGPLASLFVGIAIVLGIALVAGVIAMIRFPTRRSVEAARARGTGGPRRTDPLLDELGRSPEALAADGLYGEAIHALFLRGLFRVVPIESRTDESTARELVAASDPVRRAPLADLLGRTELVWFGGRGAGREDYERALAIERGLGP